MWPVTFQCSLRKITLARSVTASRMESRAVLDDFDPYIDEAERVELGESRVLVKDELYMPVHPSRDWIKCFVTSTQQDGFRMYLEGNSKRFLMSAKSFDIGKYYISTYEGFPNIDSKPKCGYIARVERQRDSSFLVCLDYCHLCDQKLGTFCCGRSRTEREVIAKVSHTVKRYKKVTMEFRCISVTIPTISKSGTRKVWCPRSFRKVNPSLPNSADVHESLGCTPKMGMKLVSKLPEWNEEAKNLVVRFQGSGRILVASAKNFLLYEDKYSMLDFAEQSLSHIDDAATTSKAASANNSVNGHKGATSGESADNSKAGRSAAIPQQGTMERSMSEQTEEDEVDIEAIGGSGSAKGSPVARVRTATSSPRAQQQQQQERGADRVKSDSTVRTGTSSEAGDEASRSSRASSKRGTVYSGTGREKDRERAERSKSSRDKGGDDGSRSRRSSSSRRKAAANGGDAESLSSTSPKTTPRPQSARSQETASVSGSTRHHKSSSNDPKDAVERSVLQFGKSTATRFVLDFKYPLSPLQAFGIAISAFASDEIVDLSAGHEVNHLNSPVVVMRKQIDYARSRSASAANLAVEKGFAYSPLKSPFPTS